MKNLYILLMLLLACNIYAQSNWELLSPHYNTPIEVKHVSHDGAIWAIKERAAQIIRSTDDASSWETTVFEEAINGFLITAGVISDDNGNIYCFVNNKIYSWDSATKIWRTIHTIEDNIINIYISSNILFVACNKYIETYQFPNLNKIKRFSCNSVKAEFKGQQPDEWVFLSFRKNSLKIFEFSQDADVMTTFDLPSLPPATYVKDMVMTPDGTTHLMTKSKLYSKLKNSVDWEENQLPEVSNSSELTDDGTGRIFFYTLFQLFYSDDAGRSWNFVKNLPFDRGNDIHWIMDYPGKLVGSNYECNYEAIYIKNEGKNWKIQNRSLDSPGPVKIQSALYQGILAEKCHYGAQIFDPQLNEWMNVKANQGRIQAIGVFPSGKWLAEIEYKIHVSNDKGITWEPMRNYPSVVGNHRIMLTNDNNLFVGGGFKYYTSNDEGLNWVEHNAPEFRKLGYFFDQFQKVYFSGNNIIYNEHYSIYSYDTNSQLLKRIFEDADMMNYHPNHSFMDTNGTLYFPFLIYNEDEDRYITEILEFEDINSEPKRTIVGPEIWHVDFSKNGNAVGFNSNEIFISRDFGQNWESIYYNLPEPYPVKDIDLDWIYDIAITNDNFLYVSLANGSIYVNKDILNEPALSTNEAIQSHVVTVFPNPATDYVDFNITSELIMTGLQLRILDINGKTIHSSNDLQSNQSYRWTCKNSTPGIYFYQILQEGKTLQSGKVILK